MDRKLNPDKRKEGGGGGGGNRLATLLHIAKPGDGEIIEEIVKEADLSDDQMEVLEDLLDGKEVDAEDKEDLMDTLKDELSCGEVPEGVETCTPRVITHISKNFESFRDMTD